MAVQSAPTVRWEGPKLVSIETERLTLRPVTQGDLASYQEIFNKTAMTNYRGSFNEARLETWVTRWEHHCFSALAVCDKKANVIGHAILGHGDFEGTKETGWSEIAFIMHQSHWNCDFADAEKDIGTKEMKGLGTELVLSVMYYAKEMFEKGVEVPGDLQSGEDQEIEGLRVYTEKEKPRAVFLPFTEVRATCAATNAAALKILDKAFKVDGAGQKKEVAGDRPGFLYSIATDKL